MAASVVVLLALGWLGFGFLHAAYLKYAAQDSPAYAMFLLRRGWLWCHLAGGGLGIALGLVQLVTQRWRGPGRCIAGRGGCTSPRCWWRWWARRG